MLAVLAALVRAGARFKVVGGVALNLHGIVRSTEDLDLFVDPDPENVRRVVAALREVYADPQLDEIRPDDLGGEYPAIQYVPPDGGFSIDLLSRLGEAFRYDDVECVTATVEGLAIQLATPRMLYRMKRDTVRPQDQADAARLKHRFKLEDP